MKRVALVRFVGYYPMGELPIPVGLLELGYRAYYRIEECETVNIRYRIHFPGGVEPKGTSRWEVWTMNYTSWAAFVAYCLSHRCALETAEVRG